MKARRPSPTLVAMGLLAVIAIAGLTALGIWQLERRVWKLDLIARVDHRIASPPVAAPGPTQWPTIDATHDEYLRVSLSGHFLNRQETAVQAVTTLGAGYWVLTPFVADAGFTVLVNRGFVPPEQRSATDRTAGLIEGETTVTGLLRLTEPKGGFLRANDPAADIWHSRDVAAIALTRGLSNTAPYFIDADATPNAGGWPVGGLTVISFYNHHLQYAFTWFGLALMVAGWSAYGMREELRRRGA